VQGILGVAQHPPARHLAVGAVQQVGLHARLLRLKGGQLEPLEGVAAQRIHQRLPQRVADPRRPGLGLQLGLLGKRPLEQLRAPAHGRGLRAEAASAAEPAQRRGPLAGGQGRGGLRAEAVGGGAVRAEHHRIRDVVRLAPARRRAGGGVGATLARRRGQIHRRDRRQRPQGRRGALLGHPASGQCRPPGGGQQRGRGGGGRARAGGAAALDAERRLGGAVLEALGLGGADLHGD